MEYNNYNDVGTCLSALPRNRQVDRNCLSSFVEAAHLPDEIRRYTVISGQL